MKEVLLPTALTLAYQDLLLIDNRETYINAEFNQVKVEVPHFARQRSTRPDTLILLICPGIGLGDSSWSH